MDVLDEKTVQKALDQLGVITEIVHFEHSTATAEQAAERIGTALGSIVKSLVFMVQDEPVVVLVAGDQRANDRKIAAEYGVGRKKVKIANPDQCITHVGYAPGGVPPVGHRKPVPVLIDATLGRFETIYAAAGTSNTIFPIPFSQLVTLTNGKLIDIVID